MHDADEIMASTSSDDDELARLSAIIESSDDAIITVDLHGLLTSWNPAAERMYGFSAAEAIGQPNRMIIPRDRHAEEDKIFQRILGGESFRHYETVRVRKDGTCIDVAMTASPLRDGGRAIVGITKISRDITRQKSADSERRHLAAIVEGTDDAIIGMDLAGTITSWNRGAQDMYGYTASEAVGRSVRLVLPPDRQDEELGLLDRVKAGERIVSFETIRCRKGGDCFPASLTLSPVRDDDGAVIGASKIARDITTRRRASLQAAFLGEAGAILAGSLEYETTLKAVANLAVPSIADWCAVDVLNDDDTLECVAVAHVDPAKVDLARTVRTRYDSPESPLTPASVVRTGTPAMVKEITDDMIVAAARGDQERIAVVRALGLRSYMIAPLTAHGRTFGTLSLVTAQSGRLFSDEDFRFAQEVAFRAALAVDNARAYREAQAANRLKDEFLATLSHELRTPLNAILGYLRLLQSGMIGADRQAHALGTVERNAASLTQIVEDILDVSRIVSGKIRLDIQPVDVGLVIRNAVETMIPAAEAKQIRIQTVLDSRAGPISGDPDRLQQVVWNLVSNAVKFTPKQGIVQVRLERINSHVELIVSDTGLGIAPGFLPYIFERFRQADSSTTRAHGGIGLGLAIVRHLVELHGGTVHATSGGKDQGTTFRVRLPVMIVHAEPSSERRARPAETAPLAAAALPRLDGIRILAVDDDADARSLAAETLESAGALVTTSDSVPGAVETLSAMHPDVLLADIGMAGNDGFELIRRVRESPDPRVKDIPAAALTAYARAEDRMKALQAGFQMHLAKPVDPAELIVAVAALAKQRPGPRR
ncbi:MAG TPA: PAS domain S-box protein [Vicinamibacterales bacterium]|nr:PAS domain S-box protein [Vicinamibacterales bacterium]